MQGRSHTFILAVCVALCLAVQAYAADEPPSAREQVGRPVQAAQALIKQKKFKEALAKLNEADGVRDKTPYEIYVIDETRAGAQIADGDYSDAIASLEAVLKTGMLPPAERLKRIQTLSQLAYQLKSYQSAVGYADRYYAEGGTDPASRRLVAQSYYLTGSFAEAAKTIRGILDADATGGRSPDEDLLLTLASSESKLHNDAGYRDALTQLVAVYPKTSYWTNLLAAVERAPGFPTRLALDMDRLKLAIGVMATPDQYTEAAELALEAGFPGDAQAFLAKGYEAGVLGTGPQAGRHKRLLDMAKRQSAEDAKTLPQLAREADAAAAGLAWEKLGETYASYGRYDDAAAALEKGLLKGGLAHPEDARLHLGIAYVRAGRMAKAKEVLSGITGRDGVADLAGLWLVRGKGDRP